MDSSLMNIGDLAKPADTLIEKIADAIGVLYEPTRIVRKAKGEAKANEILALSEVTTNSIRNRALNRFVYEEIQKQENIEAIIERALPCIASHANTESITKDWLFNFFNEAKMVSDSDMQLLWSNILAGESNRPGSYSKRTIGIVSQLEKSDAILFEDLLKFSFSGFSEVAVFDSSDPIYSSNNITFTTLTHLDNLGLIQFNGAMDYKFQELNKVVEVDIAGEPVILEFNNETNNSLSFGHVMLSNVGKEIALLCKVNTTDEIREYIISKWQSKGLKVSNKNLT